MITFPLESINCKPCFVRFVDMTYSNTQTCFAAPPKQNTSNTSSSSLYVIRSVIEGGTSNTMEIPPNRPLRIGLHILSQNFVFSASGQVERLTFQYPRSQSSSSLDWDLQRNKDNGNNVARSGGTRGISWLLPSGIGYDIS
jgi:hypothetical protein